jgi:hypothetical protein
VQREEEPTVPVLSHDRSDADLEDLVRAALNARSLQISEHDLRPAQPPALPSLPGIGTGTGTGWRSPRTFALAAAAAAALVLGGVLTLSHLGRSAGPPLAGSTTATPSTSAPMLGEPSYLATAPTTGPDGPHYPVDITGGARGDENVHLTFTWRTGPVPGTAARTTYPQVVISGADPDLQRHLTDTITTRINAMIDRYRTRLQSQGLTSRPLTQQIGVRADAQWRHTVSIVLDDLEDYGTTPPVATSAALVFDPRTGHEVAATDLFADVDAVDALMRKEIRKITHPGPAAARTLDGLSMHSSGSTSSLTWYTTPDGLQWLINPGVLAPDDQGQPGAMISWSRIPALLKPGARS